MFLLEGYDLQQRREQHANKRVFDGVRASDHQSVCVHDYQFGRAGHPHLPRIKSSLQGLQALLSPYLVDICQLLFREESVVVVMAEGGRPSLQSLLRDGKRFSLAQVLDIIERISAGLEAMHAKKLLHQELTPENIYLNTDGSEAKLGGFGVLRDCEQPAQLAPLERLLYLSPEHSGRMNRTIDSRSDLYSLGVVCYQLLSGEPPFQADDSLALIHAHMAQPAKVLHSVNRAIPRVVSDIVHKLLSKEAEHRYQSASGLNADIRACLQQLEEGAEITQHFEVGSLDTLSRFQIPEKLYGRHAEVQQLLNVFTRSANGHFEVVRVGGYSGVGKSALINEIQKTIVARRGIYVAGKYQQFKKSQPHSAILQVLADMVRQVLVKPQNEIDEWLSNLLPRLKGEGQCLIEVLPILQSLIGEQPPVPELNSVETLARFNGSCEALIRAFSAYTHPLIIFLDDLQWADLASLNLIEHLLGCNIPCCMLIMAYRDNEVDSHHPFSVLLHKQQEQGQAMAEIALQALSLADVQQIVADTLHQQLADIMPLAQELMAKTQGNPFYLIQLFSALQQEGHIVFRAEQGWSWHMAGIRQASLSGGVVALMSRKIKKYPQGTQNILNMCAIQGAEFTLGMSALVLGQAIDAAYQAVLPAIEDGLIQSWGECFKFAHDKIQESCYALCSAQACNQRHWQVAQQMLSGLDEAAIEGEIFTIVTHLNHGSEHLTDDQQRVDIAGFNYRAGIAAQQASAFGPALSYFKQSKTYLSDEIWQQQPGFAFELHFALAQMAYTCSQFELAEEIIKLCMHHEDEQVTITPVVQLYLDLLFSCSRHAEGIAFGLAKLREYGQSLPAKPGKLAVMREYLAFKFRQRWRSTPSLLHLAASKDDKILSVMAILSSLVPSCYMFDGNLMGIISLRMANLSLRHGNNLYSSFGYAMTGVVEIGPLKRLRSGRQYCDLSWAMEEKYPNRALKGRNVMILNSFAAPWSEPIARYEELMEVARTINDEQGIFVWADYSVVFTRTQSLFYGQASLAEIHRENVKWLGFHRANGDPQVIANQGFILHVIETMQGQQAEVPAEHADFDASQYARTVSQQQNPTFQAYFKVLNQVDAYLRGDYKACVLEGMGLWKVIFEIFGVNLDFIHRYFYVLAYLALDKRTLSWGQRIRAYGYYRLNRFYLQLFEKNHPANYGAHYALMLAEWHRSQGRLEEALRHYERAMVLSKKISLFNEALCHERLADLHERADRQQAALLSAAQARMLYQRWGNEQQVARIDSRYPQLPAVAGTVSTGSEDAATGVDGQQLDLLSLARGSMAISSEVKTEQLIEALLQQLLQTSGAQRAVLLLEDEGQLKVHGEMSSAAGEPKMHACAQPALPPDGAAMAVSVIHFVVRSKTCEVLDDAQTSANFSQDPYIVAHQLKSLLCMPIVSQGTLLGILYLENNLTRHAFTAQQQQVLTILAAQAAISMVNASLYSRLEVKVAERTQELHNTMDQLIESEKIAALGRVVAGIAHEINTPLGIALTSNSLLASDFSAINDQYHGGTMTKDDFENFLSRNHEALTLSTGNLTRVSTLVKRFKSTAAGHTGEVKVAFNLKEHLQGIVIGFAEELQAGAHGIVLDCADDVQMNSFPLALTLVMSNLINNSLQHGFKQRKEGTITLAVSASKYSEQRKIIIEYADDGVGIEQAQHKKVFDPFFTSSMGEHSGLGLHIVYNVISKQFGGSIRCGREEGAEQAGAYFYLSLSAD